MLSKGELCKGASEFVVVIAVFTSTYRGTRRVSFRPPIEELIVVQDIRVPVIIVGVNRIMRLSEFLVTMGA